MIARQVLAPPVIETRALSKRYRKVTALGEATISVPEGRISALIGPNGAGKSTLLRLLAGLARPSGGELAVLGGSPRQDPAFLAGVGFLAQEIPLYRRFTAEDHIGIGAHLNPRWDGASVRRRLRNLNIPLDQAVGTLSGGQRAHRLAGRPAMEAARRGQHPRGAWPARPAFRRHPASVQLPAAHARRFLPGTRAGSPGTGRAPAA